MTAPVTRTWGAAYLKARKLRADRDELRDTLAYVGLDAFRGSSILEIRRAVGPHWFDTHIRLPGYHA